MTAVGTSLWLSMSLLLGTGLTALSLLLIPPWLRERRRARLRAQPFPAAWRKILRRRVPMVARLPADLQRRLKRHVQVFIAEKPFIGCRGMQVNDEVRVTIAAQACLLLLGHERPDCFPRLHQVLVYPSVFVADRSQPLGAGLVRDQRQAMAGESWSQGLVVLAWTEVLAGAADSGDGRNVVLHEFAHQIDQDNGIADGQPWRPTAQARARWTAVMGAAFNRLQTDPSTVIDSYGARDPAEFFAVVTEAFFERPLALAQEAPAVYLEQSTLYGVNPLVW